MQIQGKGQGVIHICKISIKIGTWIVKAFRHIHCLMLGPLHETHTENKVENTGFSSPEKTPIPAYLSLRASIQFVINNNLSHFLNRNYSLISASTSSQLEIRLYK